MLQNELYFRTEFQCENEQKNTLLSVMYMYAGIEFIFLYNEGRMALEIKNVGEESMTKIKHGGGFCLRISNDDVMQYIMILHSQRKHLIPLYMII